jgi:precorrin-3B synthase
LALRIDGQWFGGGSVEAALEVAFGARLDLPRLDTEPPSGGRRLGPVEGFTGVAAAFGRLEASQLHALVDLAARAGASKICLSPWRAMYVDALFDLPQGLGLIVDESDPLLRIDACPGKPACRSATVDTRGTARQLAASGFSGTLHVSGCAKGCARPTAADLTLVGEGGRYGVVHNGTAREAFDRTIAADDFSGLHG